MTRPMQHEVLRQAKESSLSAVARNLRLGWKAVFGLIRRVVDEGLHRKRRRWRKLGVDEFSYGRGQQKYITVVWDHERDEVAWVGHGKAKETLLGFFAFLGPKRCRRIEFVTLDMSEAYIQTIWDAAPLAKMVFDRFHIERHLNDAVDEIRKNEFWRHGGWRRKLVAGKKWLLLRRPDRLEAEDRVKLDELLRRNARLAKAYILKEDFRQLWNHPRRKAAYAFLMSWRETLRWSRLAPLKRFWKMIWNHIMGVLNYFACRLTNAPVESQNSRTRLLSQRARGYRNHANLITMLYHCAGNLPLP